ncbi:hypothetical protein DFH06DRAFT_1138068 [Mycena polygramma]|nr:hypothetical protein DFH06DRAFT_1138068 [Mycena polygramma]
MFLAAASSLLFRVLLVVFFLHDLSSTTSTCCSASSYQPAMTVPSIFRLPVSGSPGQCSEQRPTTALTGRNDERNSGVRGGVVAVVVEHLLNIRIIVPVSDTAWLDLQPALRARSATSITSPSSSMSPLLPWLSGALDPCTSGKLSQVEIAQLWRRRRLFRSPASRNHYLLRLRTKGTVPHYRSDARPIRTRRREATGCSTRPLSKSVRLDQEDTLWNTLRLVPVCAPRTSNLTRGIAAKLPDFALIWPMAAVPVCAETAAVGKAARLCVPGTLPLCAVDPSGENSNITSESSVHQGHTGYISQRIEFSPAPHPGADILPLCAWIYASTRSRPALHNPRADPYNQKTRDINAHRQVCCHAHKQPPPPFRCRRGRRIDPWWLHGGAKPEFRKVLRPQYPPNQWLKQGLKQFAECGSILGLHLRKARVVTPSDSVEGKVEDEQSRRRRAPTSSSRRRTRRRVQPSSVKYRHDDPDVQQMFNHDRHDTAAHARVPLIVSAVSSAEDSGVTTVVDTRRDGFDETKSSLELRVAEKQPRDALTTPAESSLFAKVELLAKVL